MGCDSLAIASSNQFFTTLHTRTGKAEKTTKALIDSGASQNFINQSLVREWGLPLITLEKPKEVRTIDGSNIKSGKIWHRVELPIRIDTHNHTSSFLVTDLGDIPMILGLRWLSLHNPTINWEERQLQFKSNYCKEHCLAETLCAGMEEPYEKPPTPLTEQIPKAYHEFLSVFGEEEFKQLPPHRSYDIAIDLIEGAQLPTGPIYSMTPSESKSLKTHLEKELRNGKIRPTKSPGGSTRNVCQRSGRILAPSGRLSQTQCCNHQGQTPATKAGRPNGETTMSKNLHQV